MAAIEVSANLRLEQKTRPTRRLRHAGQVPGVIYGAKKDPVNIVLEQKALLMQLNNEAFQASILTMNLDGKKEKVLIRDVQMHPWKKQVLHIDFQRVSADQKITVSVPLHFVNEDIAPGVKQGGGIVSHILNDIQISCLPDALPEFVEVDIANLEVGQSLHISELSLPSDVESTLLQRGEDSAVVTIIIPRAVEEETPAVEDEVAETGVEENATEKPDESAAEESKES